jgi:hypothetical protein
MGLFGAGPGVTVAVLGCVLLPLLIASRDLKSGAIAAIPCCLLAATLLVKVDGVSLGRVVHRRAAWFSGSRRGKASHRAATVMDHPDAWTLPGVLEPTRLLTAQDGRGGTFGVVWNRRNGHLTATLRCAASSTWLVDGEAADGWVSNWHGWLASLGYLPSVRSVAVTVDTAPEPGARLQEAVLPRIDRSAPADTQQLVRTLVALSPGAAADIETRVSVTFDPGRSANRVQDLADHLAEVSRQLTGLESALATCGVTVLGRMGAPRLAAQMRIAFDPAARGDVERTMGGGEGGGDLLTWGSSGPMASEEAWDRYQHDSGTSVSWSWHEAPRQQVTSGVLTRLVSPGRFAKRVTMVYRPLSAGDAARILENEVNAAAFRDAYRRAQGREETAREAADRARAQRAAAEEAQGAGVVLMSLYVTATVTDPDELDGAVADVEARADQSKIRLRRLYGSQAAGFATTLPAGFVPTSGRFSA